jgi:predicted transglutaminase-like cysteine proteinase
MELWGEPEPYPVFRWIRRSVLRLVLASLVAGTVAPGAAAEERIAFQGAVSAPAGFDGVCLRYPFACASGGGPGGDAALALARQVNISVNRNTGDVTDAQQYGVEEFWALPTAQGGDCEDFALAKKRAMIARGMAPSRLLIATVLDRNGGPHAVLVFRSDRGDLVLDSLTDRIVGWRETGYTFLRIQSPADPARWQAVLSGGRLASLD